MLGICYEFLISYPSEKIWNDWMCSDSIHLMKELLGNPAFEFRLSDNWQQTTKIIMFRKTELELEKIMDVGINSSIAFEALDELQKEAQVSISKWMLLQDRDLFLQWYKQGIKTTVFVDIAMIDNQFDLELLPDLLISCSYLKSRIKLISNETFNPYDLI